jgi:hypothetical protein
MQKCDFRREAKASAESSRPTMKFFLKDEMTRPIALTTPG